MVQIHLAGLSICPTSLPPRSPGTALDPPPSPLPSAKAAEVHIIRAIFQLDKIETSSNIVPRRQVGVRQTSYRPASQKAFCVVGGLEEHTVSDEPSMCPHPHTHRYVSKNGCGNYPLNHLRLLSLLCWCLGRRSPAKVNKLKTYRERFHAPVQGTP